MYRLLIVDDEPYTADGLYELIQESGFPDLEVHRCYDAEEAWSLARRMKFDIVLSDIRMPGISGLELQRKMKNRWPMCKFIFLTGLNNSEYVRQALLLSVLRS